MSNSTSAQNSSSSMSLGKSVARRDQLICMAMAVALMFGVFLLQPVLDSHRAVLVKETGDASLRTLYAEVPRLALGGFRGLLAEVLWSNAEDAKNDRRWEDLESYYNIIGKIEPYFVTVYSFHAWNQAYNLSAQWHDVDRKYKWVLDGLEYLYEGEEYNPGNPDLMKDEADMYFLKLGGAFERIEFRAHWRDDIASQYRNVHSAEETGGITEDTLKEVRSAVSEPQFHATWIADRGPRGAMETGHGIAIDYDADSNLSMDKHRIVQYRHGLSPFYFAWIEYQRCNLAGGPTTTGKKVAESLVPMSLRLWCRDDIYYTEDGMIDMFINNKYPVDSRDFDEKYDDLKDCFRNILGDDKTESNAEKAVREFQEYLLKYPYDKTIHNKHMEESRMLEAMARPQRDLLEALFQWAKQGKNWQEGDRVNQFMRQAMADYATALSAMTTYENTAFPDPRSTDRTEFEAKYVTAVKANIQGIETFLTAEDHKAAPDLSFLKDHIVEK